MRTVIWFLCAALRWDAVLTAICNEMKWYVTGSQLTNENDDVNITSLFCIQLCLSVSVFVCVWLSVWRLIVPFGHVASVSGNGDSKIKTKHDLKMISNLWHKMCCRSKWFAFREFYLRLSWLICCYSICCLTFSFFSPTWNAIKNDRITIC